MQSIKFHSHAGPDGMLKFEVPVGQSDTDFEVMVIVQPMMTVAKSSPDSSIRSPQDLGWPAGYFEQTEGSLEDDPIARPVQSEFETREALL